MKVPLRASIVPPLPLMTSYFLSFLFLLLAVWMAWRYFALRRSIREITSRIERNDELPIASRELGALVRAIHARRLLLENELATAKGERAKLSAILEQMTDGVLIADADGRVQFANPAAQRLFGWALVGHSVAEAVRHHSLVQAWQRCIETNEPQTETVEAPLSHHFLQLVVIPDRNTRGGALLLVQDLTRVRRLETVRRDFISNLSHELRTPLASLKALTETLQDGALADPEAAPRFLSRIQAEVDALTQMAQEMLDLSKIESGQVALELKPIAPEKLLASAAERMRLQAERAGLRLRLDCPPNLPHVQADAPRVEQVLVNLIHNAVKFTRPGGEVALRAEEGQDVVQFAVADTGIGIPADELPRIFERFYRVDKSRAGGGTGLGLSISRHLVEAHGGRIWAESREGEGSTFCFTLPTRKV